MASNAPYKSAISLFVGALTMIKDLPPLMLALLLKPVLGNESEVSSVQSQRA